MGQGTTDALFGDGRSTNTTTVAPAMLSEEEKQLVAINTELARKQLANVNALQPFQKEMLELTMAELRRSGAESSAMDAAITPEQRAAQAKSEFERAQRLGPIQDQILQMQLDAMQGKISPEQEAAITEAIKAGGQDIDNATGEGIGLIADELANSRGLRLTDTPILREATLLAESGMKQKSSLAANLRAQSVLGLPAQTASIGMGQQNLASQTQAFQAELRNRAAMNRMAMTGQTSSSGIGLASVGSGAGVGTLGALSGIRNKEQIGWDPSARMTAGGQLMQGIGGLMGSDRRLKNDYGVVAKTESGIDLHLYRYKWESEDAPLRLGVMADDVERVKPEAVSTGKGGFKMVDYARL